ncbi:meiotic cell cortex C-terminal pleckstrin homology-domain-containing protein [Mycena latifolia]|nr:meiotic cell cortex C-terminal pleckstrin homology-domain-containing protein [Mycena latifolia]
MVAPRVEEPVAVQDPVKPETNEISTQTEEWAPLPPPPVPVAVTTPPSLPISQQRTSSLSRVSSVISLVHDEAHVCVALSEVQSVADKKRPPAPSLPPSLRAPSPDIPERHFGVLPPRPSSPTPPERTTALSFDSVPMLRGSTDTGGYLHQRGSSMPSSLQHTLGLRSATNSTVSLVSEHDVSQRSSINSRPDPTAEAADAVVVHAVTQTMIGEFLFKYMRKAIGKGYGERRHKRFFWVHPYTETLYWSSEDPRSSNVSESTAKSAYIEDVRSVLDPNPIPPGLYQYSIVVSTPEREIKITAPTKERHDIWLNALAYLLAARPHTSNHSPSNALQVAQGPMSDVTDDDRWSVSTSPQSRPSTRSAERGDVWNTSPRREGSRLSPSAGGSLSKRSRTSFEYPRWSGPESPSSPSKSLVDVPEDLEFEFHGAAMEENESDDFENVCTYCDGKHAVGHHHHRLTENVSDEGIPARPVSSSGWSFHSGAGSTNSRDRGSFFTWGHKEGAKRRFGSPRFGKAPVV